MSQHTSAVPPPLPTQPAKPRRNWRWLKIILGIVLGLVLITKVIEAYDPVNLEVAVSYNQMTIGNVGSKPIKIISVEVNDRTDCTINLPITMFTDPNKLEFSPSELKVGDEIELVSSCKIIRANIETDQGSATYSFH